MDDFADFPRTLDAAHRAAAEWVESLPDRPIAPAATIDDVKDALGRELNEAGEDPHQVIERLVRAATPGLIAMPSPRFYGWVIGGSLPAALGADWLVSSWDQNAVFRTATPGVTGVEEVAGDWALQILGLPRTAGIGFATGATMANFTCLVTARNVVLRNAGWDGDERGLGGGPRIRFIAGAERHGSVDLAGRMAGLGLPTVVTADTQGRIDVDALERELTVGSGPAIVALQAGNLHSGDFDDFAAGIAVAHAAGAWVHIDGAFGLWAAASRATRPLVAGFEAADSWATDAHKTLNTPYDCGLAIVADRAAQAAALGVTASYLFAPGEVPEPYYLVPEMSRRARGVPVWAALRQLGRSGVERLVDGLASAAKGLADGFSAIPGIRVVNDVVFTQVCIAAHDDAATAELGDLVRAGGVAYASSSRWRGQGVLRFSISNAHTDAIAVARTIETVADAAARLGLEAESAAQD